MSNRTTYSLTEAEAEIIRAYRQGNILDKSILSTFAKQMLADPAGLNEKDPHDEDPEQTKVIQFEGRATR